MPEIPAIVVGRHRTSVLCIPPGGGPHTIPEAEIQPPRERKIVRGSAKASKLALGDAQQALATLYRALAPGGVFGVVDNRGDPAVPQDPRAKSGYVRQDYAIRLIEAAGFRLVATSEVNANPKDTKNYPSGVWALPPDYRLGNINRAQYEAIGESDRFTLKLIKPGND